MTAEKQNVSDHGMSAENRATLEVDVDDSTEPPTYTMRWFFEPDHCISLSACADQITIVESFLLARAEGGFSGKIQALLSAVRAEGKAGWKLVPEKITPEIGHALESNFAECLPPSRVHAANWQDAWSKALAAAPSPQGG